MAWLYRITVNTCRDALRRRARRREVALDNVPLPAGNDPWLNELARERRRAVWQAVQSLDTPLLLAEDVLAHEIAARRQKEYE